VRAAQRRFLDSIADAETAGRMAEELALGSPTVVPWRSTAGFSFIELGELSRARELAAEELALAEATGAPRAILRALRCLALAEGGDQGQALLRQAEEMVAAGPRRIEGVESLIALGATLRRSNHRAAARQPLERAAAIAEDGGAHMLAQTALVERAATGVRGRHMEESGVASLTASQRRVADLAAQGLTTREMSKVLYVTPKTIEYHLRQIYRKLGIGSRSELAHLLAE
jgi:DNA-binding CsgD family transcriptional regulator